MVTTYTWLKHCCVQLYLVLFSPTYLNRNTGTRASTPLMNLQSANKTKSELCIFISTYGDYLIYYCHFELWQTFQCNLCPIFVLTLSLLDAQYWTHSKYALQKLFLDMPDIRWSKSSSTCILKVGSRST